MSWPIGGSSRSETERPLRRFLRLSSAKRRLLVEAAVLLETIKLGLRLLPFKILRRLLTRVSRASAGTLYGTLEARAFVREVTWAIEAASLYIPGTKTCLVRALAAQVLLDRRGCPSLLHIGVLKGVGGRLQAHAWVESGGEVLIGGEEAEPFTLLTTLNEKGL